MTAPPRPPQPPTPRYTIAHADIVPYLRGRRWMVQNGFIEKAHAVFCDPPYFLGSISKRYGKSDSAIARPSESGQFRYDTMSKGFMGQTWDGFESVWHYQSWVTEWAALLLDFVHPGAVGAFFGGTRTYHRLAAGLEDAGWEVFDCMMFMYGSGFPKNHRTRVPGFEGHGSALKPSYEPIILARAPRPGTYAECAQQYGTAALNVDGCRIPSNGDVMRRANNVTIGGNGIYQEGTAFETGAKDGRRWPANTILVCPCESDEHAADCPVRVLGEQSGDVRSSCHVNRSNSKGGSPGFIGTTGFAQPGENTYSDTGTAARFFYTAKAAAWEREAGLHNWQRVTVNDGRDTPIDNPYQRGETQRRNAHPTVKPLQLTEYIARLLLPPELDTPRRLLVPFAGSGSEMIGALLAGWDIVHGIELTNDYIPLARARLAWWNQYASYEQAQAAYKADVDDQQRRNDEAAAGVEQLSLFAA